MAPNDKKADDRERARSRERDVTKGVNRLAVDSADRGGVRSPKSSQRSPTKRDAGKSSGGKARDGSPAPKGEKSTRGSDEPQKPALSNKRIDLPAEAYLDPTSGIKFPTRPAIVSRDPRKKVSLDVNQFNIEKINTKLRIYQYDVSGKYIGERVPKNLEVVIKKAWADAGLKQALKQNEHKWLYDGKTLAWSTADMASIEHTVDLDLLKDRESTGKNKVVVRVRRTTSIDLSSITKYVRGETDMDNSVLEGINFLDHLIRQYPSEKSVAIKRQFYDANTERHPLAPHVVGAKGTYASVRLNNSAANTGLGLGINVDVVNTAFWWDQNCSIVQLAGRFLLSSRWSRDGFDSRQASNRLHPATLAGEIDDNSIRSLSNAMRPSDGRVSQTFQELKKVNRIRVRCPHLVKHGLDGTFTMNGFALDRDYGAQGVTANTYKFEYQGKSMRYVDYCLKKYGIRLRYPDFPLIQTTRPGTLLAAELCFVEPLQRYPYKLDPEMTSKMIRQAVTRPNDRKNAIERGRDSLRWNEDPYLKHFGISISRRFTSTEAVLLTPPRLAFGARKAVTVPNDKARWDLRGLTFKSFGTDKKITRWGIAYDPAVNPAMIDEFAKTFIKAYRNHGGEISQEYAVKPIAREPEHGLTALEDLLATPTKRGDLIFVIVSSNSAYGYEQIKKVADCKLGIVTQVVQRRNVQRNDAQYHSNVCLKVNAKMGGVNSVAEMSRSVQSKLPMITIGVDVSHAPVGMAVPSMASMTMSCDGQGVRYAAAVETNGFRKEMLTTQNAYQLLESLSHSITPEIRWCERMMYIRDGVSEGQFQQVLDEEVTAIRKWWTGKTKKPLSITVVIATKRHHIRFFPGAQGDKNNNPRAGTIVESDVTHPHNFDFYLCSHSAIQGTARPVHYNVIMDENKFCPHILQQWIFESCFQYARSTTAVSLHPAVYYAHLASNRARSHERSNSRDNAEPSDAKLLAMGGRNPAFRNQMWYI